MYANFSLIYLHISQILAVLLQILWHVILASIYRHQIRQHSKRLGRMRPDGYTHDLPFRYLMFEDIVFFLQTDLITEIKVLRIEATIEETAQMDACTAAIVKIDIHVTDVPSLRKAKVNNMTFHRLATSKIRILIDIIFLLFTIHIFLYLSKP